MWVGGEFRNAKGKHWGMERKSCDGGRMGKWATLTIGLILLSENFLFMVVRIY
jgi:hypothetical protein